ncbi:hypothetical protein SEA_EMMA1919_233 [Streptomyces phage Emma1919]|uniref:Uncharacterized protein n=2 Tax=Gilsonvirus gilson TaxID=2846398 RepID=A0A3T0ICV1_9CAUD|nr:hypothetical protein HWB98_gp055 [Streptomyces phage Gilson]AZU97274.1 hypothetical protein SEA_GILSON_229 [Streptomyces phage Gilson]QQV92572.1 hypothetical protein SEA_MEGANTHEEKILLA_235 [Streptomyces phage MeganTheeKilla]URQ04814.1 hypothetical protein SEA_EMMA1919_233 [Streptomyces phage Emma1919]
MPKVRAKNERSGIVSLGAHHLYKAPRFPNPRTSTEDFCPAYHRLQLSLKNSESNLKVAGKAVLKKQTQENIEKLKAAKDNIRYTKELIFSHLGECDDCK